jgi:hypothetical protein
VLLGFELLGFELLGFVMLGVAMLGWVMLGRVMLGVGLGLATPLGGLTAGDGPLPMVVSLSGLMVAGLLGTGWTVVGFGLLRAGSVRTGRAVRPGDLAGDDCSCFERERAAFPRCDFDGLGGAVAGSVSAGRRALRLTGSEPLVSSLLLSAALVPGVPVERVVDAEAPCDVLFGAVRSGVVCFGARCGSAWRGPVTVVSGVRPGIVEPGAVRVTTSESAAGAVRPGQTATVTPVPMAAIRVAGSTTGAIHSRIRLATRPPPPTSLVDTKPL